MRWPSPWGEGFPGWHLECSAMSTKYLGETFDIHGGGNDLKFPHHENEIAQNVGSCSHAGARYWLHTNMLLLNGKKMSKSDGNTISPTQLFSGDSPHVSKGYSPMTVKFFMLQAHYGSPLDLTDEGLQAAEKGYRRLMESYKTLQSLTSPSVATVNSDLDREINDLIEAVYTEMSDDFNTPKAMARLFELVTRINSLNGGQLSLADVSAATLERLKETFTAFIDQVFGLKDESDEASQSAVLDDIMQVLINLRLQARANKDWATSDKIRDELKEAGVILKDSKEGTSWTLA